MFNLKSNNRPKPEMFVDIIGHDTTKKPSIPEPEMFIDVGWVSDLPKTTINPTTISSTAQTIVEQGFLTKIKNFFVNLFSFDNFNINTGNSITEWRFQKGDDPNEQNYLNIIIGFIALIILGIAFGYFIYCSCCKKSKALKNNPNSSLDDIEVPFIDYATQRRN